MFPWQQQNAEPRFALLLTRLEDGINVDRSALRQAGLTRLHSVSHGEKALEIIRGQAGGDPALAVDLVICSGDLDDMSISAFMRALASLGSPLPVMVISGNDDELARAISQGSAATLRRPYSMNELARALENLHTQKRASAAPKLEKTAPPPHQAEPRPEDSPAPRSPAEAGRTTGNKLLQTRDGFSMLRQGKTEQARYLFTGALSFDPLDIDAALGLSRLYQQDGDMEKSHRWLHRAGHICLLTRQPERAEALFARLPEKWQGDHEMIEAQELLQEGDFDAACAAFINICTSRKDMPLHRLLGRACQFTLAPDECMRELIAAFARSGYESTAQTLAARLLTDEEEYEWEPGGLLAAFPRLQEAWAVARFTAQALRASG